MNSFGVISNYNELREKLSSNADDEFRKFTKKLILSERPILGVKIPKIKELASMVQKEKISEFLRVEPMALEEVLMRGFLICRLPYGEMIKWFDSQIDYIDNWCTCDTFCSGLRKLVQKKQAEFLELKITELLGDKREFAVRVGLVLLKCYYVNDNYLDLIFDKVEKLGGREEYYVKMAIAWLVAECFIKFPNETLEYLSISRLPNWTYNKAISKICDSLRVEPEMKEVLKRMRR